MAETCDHTAYGRRQDWLPTGSVWACTGCGTAVGPVTRDRCTFCESGRHNMCCEGIFTETSLALVPCWCYVLAHCMRPVVDSHPGMATT